MTIEVELVGSVELPGAGRLVSGYALESRGDVHRALLAADGGLAVHDLADVAAGDLAPRSVFPFPWPGWDRGAHSVSPDGEFAALSGQRSVRAVDRDGSTRWEFRHPCWSPEAGHVCAEDGAEACRHTKAGSCRVSDDGAVVWAHVRAAEDVHGGAAHEEWVVLDSADGRLLARTPLDSVAEGSNHVGHHDGVHMGLGIGEGQDGSLLYWGRWDGAELHLRDLNDGNRILIDVHPAHAGFLTLDHEQADLALHDLHGEVLASAPAEELLTAGGPPAAGGDDGDDDDRVPYWDYYCGFVDADTVLAGTAEYDTSEYDEPLGRARHWLLDARTLELLGQVRHPAPDQEFVRPLGDGTWLTHRYPDGLVQRWRVSRR